MISVNLHLSPNRPIEAKAGKSPSGSFIWVTIESGNLDNVTVFLDNAEQITRILAAFEDAIDMLTPAPVEDAAFEDDQNAAVGS